MLMGGSMRVCRGHGGEEGHGQGSDKMHWRTRGWSGKLMLGFGKQSMLLVSSNNDDDVQEALPSV
jgi:hypothetical protein